MKRDERTVQSNFKIFILMVVTVLILICMFRFDFSSRVDYQVRNMVTDHLTDINKQSVKALENELECVVEEVSYAAEYLSRTQDITREEEQLLYSQLKEKCGFANVRLVSGDGKLYSSDYKPLPRSVGGYIEAIGRGETGMTDIFLSGITGAKVFGFYAPVYKNDIISGGIAGIMIVEQIRDIIATTGFNSESYDYVLKPDGSVVSQTSHEFSLYHGRDYLEFLRSQVKNGDSIARTLQTSMENGDSGVFSYQAGKESRIACYRPACCKDWYVVTSVSTKVADEYVNHINMTAIYLTIKVVGLFIILAVVILCWFHKTKKLILESKENVELEKKKLELALRYSTNSIFEYKVKEDCLAFITPPVIKGKYFPQILKNVTQNMAEEKIVAPEYMEEILDAFKRVSDGEAQEPIEFKGGPVFEEEIWFKLTISPVQDAKGEVIEIIATMEDITQERDIRCRFAQEEQYREALLAESVAVWSVDLLKKQVIACTLSGKNVLERRKSSISYSISFIRNFIRNVHEDDKDRIENMVQLGNMLTAYYVGTKELKDLFRICYPGSGGYKWVTCVISLLTEPTSGNPIAFAYVRDVDEETRREMELSYSSERDPLTGLYNRRNIAEKINHILKKESALSCLMMMDLDGFKGINDNYGHQTGDTVLKELAQILVKSFRTDDYVARLGGDEFLVFLSDLPDRDSARSRAESVRKQVFEMMHDDVNYDVSISIGLAFSPMDGTSFMKLYQCADEALYCAKRAGKNQIKIYGW